MSDPYTIEGSNGLSLMNQVERDAVLEAIGPEDWMCEIGSFHGASCRYWASRRPGAKFLCVDNFALGIDPKEAIAVWFSNRLPNMHLLVGTVDDLLLLLPGRKFNVILVDGGHSEKSCLNDLEMSRTLLILGGSLLVHDYSHDKEYPERGVAQAVETYCEMHQATICKLTGTIAFLRDS